MEQQALALMRMAGALPAAGLATMGAPSLGEVGRGEGHGAENRDMGGHDRHRGKGRIPPPCAVEVEDQR